jgi:hypothetical protein
MKASRSLRVVLRLLASREHEAVESLAHVHPLGADEDTDDGGDYGLLERREHPRKCLGVERRRHPNATTAEFDLEAVVGDRSCVDLVHRRHTCQRRFAARPTLQAPRPVRQRRPVDRAPPRELSAASPRSNATDRLSASTQWF